MRLLLAVTLLAFLAGCGSKKNYQTTVRNWGLYRVDDGMRLQVSAVGMTQMRYELRHEPTNKTLVTDYGRDTKGWFFVWDDRDRLWAHWADLGTVVWVPDGRGGFEKQWLRRGNYLLDELPEDVYDHLPAYAKEDLGLY